MMLMRNSIKYVFFVLFLIEYMSAKMVNDHILFYSCFTRRPHFSELHRYLVDEMP